MDGEELGLVGQLMVIHSQELTVIGGVQVDDGSPDEVVFEEGTLSVQQGDYDRRQQHVIEQRYFEDQSVVPDGVPTVDGHF